MPEIREALIPQPDEEERSIVRAASKLSENGFQEAWDNPDDAEYD